MDYNIVFESDVLPEYSIVIPTYLRPKLLAQAIESALNQNCSLDYEVVVVDNNPERNDATELAVAQFARDKRFSYCKNDENIGMVGNFNRLFELAKGEFVIMLHDDDLLSPDYLDIIHKFQIATRNKYGVILPGRVCSSHRQAPVCHDKLLTYREIDVFDFASGNIIGPPVGMMVSKKIFSLIGGFRSIYYPSIDVDFYIRALAFTKFCYIENPLTLYYWGVNESLKQETVIGFYKNTLQIKDSIVCEKHNLSAFVHMLAFRGNIIRLNSSLAKTVPAEYISLGMNEINFSLNTVRDFLSYFVTRVLLFRYLIIKKLKIKI